MKELAVIYNIDTGFIDGGAFTVDRNQTPDGSTAAESVDRILAKDSKREILYVPYQSIFGAENYIVENGKLRGTTNNEKATYKAIIEAKKKKDPTIEDLIKRIEALEAAAQ